MSAPLRVSVTQLVARAGGPGLAGFGSSERMALGSLLHRLYQERAAAADPGYRCELALSAVIEQGGRAVRVEGRADGVRILPDGTRQVEELKSAADGLPRLPGRLALEQLQVELYAFLLAQDGAGPVCGELVWLAPGEAGGAAVAARQEVPIDLARIEARLRALLGALVAEADRRDARAALRRAEAAALAFPFPSERRGQAEIAAAVAHALAERRHLMLEAPTGVGKTIAVLLPALRHAFLEGTRVLLLTSRGSQQRGALAALARIAPPGSAAASVLRAKRELCASGTLVCGADACRFASDYGRKLAEGDVLGKLLAGAPVLGAEDLRAAGRAAEACPHALARQAAREAAVTVADYNYALDPVVLLPELAPGERLDDVVLLLDEAHQAHERARDARSAELAAETLERLAARAALGGAPVHERLREAARALAAGVAGLAADAAGGGAVEGDGEVEWELGSEALAAERGAFEDALAAYFAYRLETRSFAADDPILADASEVTGFGGALARAGRGYATSVAWQRGAPRLRVHCLEPERDLAALFARCRSVVAFSATLQPFALRRELLGLPEERTDTLAVGSPFPRRRRALVIEPRADTRFRARARELPRLARRLAAFAESVPGHVLALAPSFAWIDGLRAELAPAGRQVLAQASGDGPRERERLLAALAAEPEPPVLLLAAAGGFFGEGVEWPGRLAGVAVVGPCLPPPSLSRELLRRRLEERFGSEEGFTLAYALPGMTRVVQGAGRLIRSERDRGVVALYGRRFLAEPWRSLLPAEWTAGGEPEDLVGDPARVARAFFASPED